MDDPCWVQRRNRLRLATVLPKPRQAQSHFNLNLHWPEATATAPRRLQEAAAQAARIRKDKTDARDDASTRLVASMEVRSEGRMTPLGHDMSETLAQEMAEWSVPMTKEDMEDMEEEEEEEEEEVSDDIKEAKEDSSEVRIYFGERLNFKGFVATGIDVNIAVSRANETWGPSWSMDLIMRSAGQPCVLEVEEEEKEADDDEEEARRPVLSFLASFNSGPGAYCAAAWYDAWDRDHIVEFTEAEEENPSPASPCETLEDFLNLEPSLPPDSKLSEQHAKDFSTRLTPDASGDVQQDFAECLGMRSQDLDTSLCQSFCTSKGLDLSGIVGGKECRCGASRLNRAVWMGGDPRPGLLLPSEPMSECRTEHRESCPMRVYRLRGPFPSFGVPPTHLQLSAQDISYMDSIVSGGTRDVPKESSPDPDLASPSATAPSLVTWDYRPPGFLRPCDGYGSCGAVPNWRLRSSNTSGEWEEVAFVHYYFEVNTDQTRKEAFREATATYHRWTCIRFVEVERSFTGAKLGVGNYDSMSCNARAGYSSYWNRFNLGSCMNLNHMGEILHNLGHVLGMLDEQKRPDAARNVWGHGPHLQVFWDNVPTNWRPYIFNPVEDAYTGSATRNPWAGNYAPYDFDSIMHFHPMLFGSQIYETIPSVQMRNVGQRNSLSEGDILQLLGAREGYESAAGMAR
ncbi:Astacin-like metalloendopeptidase [Symbiodinium microadriaticum]|uniref:Astacin-like metalloendopeptidase n=1 Tax=Symbiodinium microadriaticum TaxID=2951 RepID=A0A1Q9DRU4_SYMMI|nr:Astacin-like metalloendopeptidase [Symbiodinium microadriaticum]